MKNRDMNENNETKILEAAKSIPTTWSRTQ